MVIFYTQADIRLIEELRARGITWDQIASILKRSSGQAVREHYQRFIARRDKCDGLERKRAIQGRLAQIPQPQTLGQALLGHPLPGRSALDKMRDKTRATTKQPKHKAISPSVSILDISVPAREIMGNDNG